VKSARLSTDVPALREHGDLNVEEIVFLCVVPYNSFYLHEVH
jgi:hypothetical protein